MKKTICVFCGSSEDLDKMYYQTASIFGEQLAQRSYDLIHGAGTIGLMGSLMKAASTNGAKVTGVVPERLNRDNIVSEEFQKLVVTSDMKERKEFMRNKSDAFVALPGGFGTLEELLEVITLKQLKYHNKPIVIFNAFGIFDHLLSLFDNLYKTKFTNQSYSDLYFVTNNIEEAFDYIENYQAKNIYDKYLKE